MGNLLITSAAFSLPVDWQGKFGVNSTIIENYRKTGSNDLTTSTTDNGSQIVPSAPGGASKASFQDYHLRLSPSIIINDSASFYAEITTGHNNTGRFGDSTVLKKENSQSMGNALYPHSTTTKNANLLMSKLYLNLYSDTATYTVGRHSFHWGLGALYNDGQNELDRYSTTRDGVMANMKVGNFFFNPYWAKINSLTSMTNADDTSIYGIGIKYDNPDRDLSFGILYGKQSTKGENNTYKSADGTNPTIGRSIVKIVDLYIKKSFGDFDVELEAPIVNGNMVGIFDRSENKYKANAILIQSSYKITENWKTKLHLGNITGEDGKPNDYHALYLNPNYQVANILFRYNLHAVNDGNQNIYDSYMTNAKFLKLTGVYELDSWKFELSYIYAKANEVAKQGSPSYNHENNKFFTANYSQGNRYGAEIDFNTNYKWNQNISLYANTGYLFTGDYYKFTNQNVQAKRKNSYSLAFGLMSSF